jgi:hypothetical protein
MNGKSIGGILIVLFLLFFFIGVMRNAKGFSQAAGTLFSGTNTLGKTLEGR